MLAIYYVQVSFDWTTFGTCDKLFFKVRNAHQYANVYIPLLHLDYWWVSYFKLIFYQSTPFLLGFIWEIRREVETIFFFLSSRKWKVLRSLVLSHFSRRGGMQVSISFIYPFLMIILAQQRKEENEDTNLN